MRILSVGSGFPPHYYGQDELLAALREVWAKRHHNPDRLERLHKNVLVGGRHLALPIDQYAGLTSFGAANDAWIAVAQEVGETAVRDALGRAGLAPGDVAALFFVTVTGVATPSIDARLVNRLGLSPQVKRVPIFGLGCVAGAAGIARAADYVRAFPDEVAVLLSVELCSLTLQREDLSIPNLIASGLFGDGAAAVVVAGGEHPLAGGNGGAAGPRVLATRSVFYPDSERVMGWDVSERGFGIVLSAEVPEVARRFLAGDVDRFLADHGLTRADIGSWVCHPGGPKVLEAMEKSLELPAGALDVTWRSLREVGNLSSTSVLLVLQDTLDHHRPSAGTLGLLLAMGPGFCSELVLLEW
ncbi:MAG TPA: 3-oxoacyl-[acyl-carrier-protein] synthase III C-terminal domain-containing protein [Thermoanaerobaculia bacterium]|nr:3-oxoacyl-[acyl-carrier-protein] synthase III C-terminal domain-containing protein [Thermoanaerobaculia bacterium]